MKSTRQWTQHTYQVIINLTQLQSDLRQNNLNVINSLSSDTKSTPNNNVDLMVSLNTLKK